MTKRTYHSPKPSVRDEERLEERSWFPAAAEAKLEGSVEGMSAKRLRLHLLRTVRANSDVEATVELVFSRADQWRISRSV